MLKSQSAVDQVNRDDIVTLASELIAIPSPSGEELDVMEFVSRWTAEQGLHQDVRALDPKRPNVIISVGSADDGPTIAMNGHLDTVPISDPDAWSSHPYDPTVTADSRKLVGRGASDMKSSVAVMMYVARLLKDAPLKGRIEVHVVSDEETSGVYGTQFLIGEMEAGRMPKPDYCLIGEKSDLKVRNAERGILGVEITFHGRASHTASARATGINAIAKAAKGVLALEGDIDRFHPAVGKPVISVNTMAAGVAHNVVPGEAHIRVDRRLVPGETKESAVAEMRAALDAVASDDPDFKYTMNVDPTGDFIAANITEASSPIVAALQASVKDITGADPEYFVAWAGATDGRFYRQAGIDTVGYGPGGENAHGANEAVFIDDLVTQARVYVDTISRLLLTEA